MEHIPTRKLNNYDYSNIDEIIHFLKTDEYPKEINTIAKRKRYGEKFKNDFIVRKNKLFYKHTSPEAFLEVVSKDNISTILSKIYNDKSLGMGHGIKQFYRIVISKYLNITRKETEGFLENQIPYQLTRKYIKAKNPTKKFTKENIAWSIDLIDMSQYSNRNKNFRYIMSVIDLYSKKGYLQALKRKTPEEILNHFKKIVTPENKSKILFSDNGLEFKSAFADYLKSQDIKVITTKSYSPQPDIENFNGQVRKMLSELFVRNKDLVWINDLKKIQDNLNKFNDLPFNQIKREKNRESNLANHTNINKESKFQIGNTVRIRQSAIISNVRKMYKSNLQKHIHVKYSVDLFKIFKIYKPKTSNGFFFYGLTTDEEEPERILNTDGTISQFKEIDLMLIKGVNGIELTATESNKLNQI